MIPKAHVPFRYSREEAGVYLENIMFAPDGETRVIPRSRVRRWWLRRRGWKLYVGPHFFPAYDPGIITDADEFDPPILRESSR